MLPTLKTPLSPRIRCLTVEDMDAMDPQVIKELDRIVHANQNLPEPNVVVQEVNIFSQAKRLIDMCHDHPSCLCLTLLEHTKDSRGRIIAVVVTGGRGETTLVETTQQTFSKERMPDVYQNLELLQWSCDHVSTPESDSFFSLLDFVRQWFSCTATSFSLDVS